MTLAHLLVDILDAEIAQAERDYEDIADRTDDAPCPHCGAQLASDGDCGRCEAEYARTGRIG